MKKVIFSIIVFFMVTICFVGKVSADDKVCNYRAETDGRGFGFDLAQLTIKNKKKAEIRFTSLYGPAISDFTIVKNQIDINKKHHYADKHSAKINLKSQKLTYYDSKESKETTKISDIDFGDNCPEEVIVVFNDTAKGLLGWADFLNMQVFVGNSTTASFIQSRINENLNYNYMVHGGKFEMFGEDVEPSSDDQGGNESGTDDQDDEDLDTCEGLLGNKVDGEYAEGTVGFLLQKIFDYMKMAVVILVFAFSLIDYAKAIAAQDSEVFKKANMNFLKRIAFGIIFFLIPELVDLILGVIDASSCGIK